MNKDQHLGSQTAKNGFKNEKDIVQKFNNWQTDTEVQKCLQNNKSLIVSDILKGRGKFSAEWMLVAQKIENQARWILKPMNYCLNFFGNGDVLISPRGTLKIGKITMQRKGGDGGRPTANMLQFKINPAELFE